MTEKKRKKLLQNVRSDKKEQIINYTLRQARVEANLTGKELGKQLGISTPTYFHYEHLRYNAPENLKIKIAEILGKSVKDLFPENLGEIVGDLDINSYNKKEERLTMLNEKAKGEFAREPTSVYAGGQVHCSVEFDAKLLESLLSPLDIDNIPEDELPTCKENEISVNYNELKKRIEKVLNTLTFREREVIKLRYGLGDDKVVYNLAEVGKKFKVTKERVRQIEFKALGKLQHPVRSKYLEDFLVA